MSIVLVLSIVIVYTVYCFLLSFLFLPHLLLARSFSPFLPPFLLSPSSLLLLPFLLPFLLLSLRPPPLHPYNESTLKATVSAWIGKQFDPVTLTTYGVSKVDLVQSMYLTFLVMISDLTSVNTCSAVEGMYLTFLGISFVVALYNITTACKPQYS